MVIVLAGMISSGKTTVTRKLAKELGTTPFFEPVEDNPILEKYYEDMEKWGFALQIFFLNKRFKMIKEAYKDNNNVLDRSIYEDALFTRVNNSNGNISDIEYELYLDLLNNMLEDIEGMPKKSPDLLIYLDTDIDKVLANIKKRGREYEIDKGLIDYYKQLLGEYEHWYNDYDVSPKMKIDTTEYDVNDDWANILESIYDKMKELELL